MNPKNSVIKKIKPVMVNIFLIWTYLFLHVVRKEIELC